MDKLMAFWKENPHALRYAGLLFLLALLVVSTGWVLVNHGNKTVVVLDEGRSLSVKTRALRVQDLLAEQGISIEPEDQIHPPLDHPLHSGMVITIHRAFPVQIIVDGQVKKIKSTPRPVSEVLQMAGVELGSLDQVSPSLEEQVAPGVPLRVIRVREQEEKLEKKIPFEVVRKPEGNMEKGMTRTVQRGQPGIQEETYKVIYHDGQEVKRELIRTRIVREPVAEILAYGTLELASRGGDNFRFDRSMWVTATAYSHSAGSITATGTYARRGTIAVDPRVIPLGTRLYVEGYGYGVAEDTGGAIKGDKIDVFFETDAEAYRWGVRRVKLYILE